MERVNDIKVILKISHDGQQVNTIEETGSNAWMRLSTVLVQQNNDKRNVKVWGTIDSKTGLQVIKARSNIGQGYVYEYHFSGLACEDLPRL